MKIGRVVLGEAVALPETAAVVLRYGRTSYARQKIVVVRAELVVKNGDLVSYEPLTRWGLPLEGQSVFRRFKEVSQKPAII